jgi:predicted TIM-barrel fold metal-dependent hydrolase
VTGLRGVEAPLLRIGRGDSWHGAIVDVDVHAVVPSVEALFPYLPAVWRQHVRERGFDGPPNDYTYPPALRSSVRPEWRPPNGDAAASSASLLREHILDPWRTDHAVVNCYYGLDVGPPDFASALAHAVNDWLSTEWLEADDRLLASIVVPGHDPAPMIAEIERMAENPRFVQVLLPVRSGYPYGDRLWHPLFDAIAGHDLVAGIHWGGGNLAAPPTPSGWPSWWVDRTPMSIIREHVRFSTAPIDAGPPAHMRQILEWLGSDDLLMFATDYPHMHDDDVAALLELVSDSAKEKVMAATARDWYRI